MRAIDAALDTRETFVKVPRALMGQLVAGSGDLRTVEDALTAGHILRWWEMYGESPTAAQLAEARGIGDRRLRDSIDRLKADGVIVARKTPYRYAKSPGGDKYAARWRYEIPEGSPLLELMAPKTGDGPKQRTWIPVPYRVARYRSVLCAATFIVLHEQMVMDKVVVTGPTALSRMLRCHRSTAQALLRYLDARPVAKGPHGSHAYVLPLALTRPADKVATVQNVAVAVHGDSSIQFGQLDEVRRMLRRAHLDPDAAERDALGQIVAAGVPPTLHLLVRVLEETHLRVLVRDDSIRRRLSRRFGSRLRGAFSLAAPTKRRRDERRTAFRSAAAALAPAAATCADCDGTGLVLVEQDDGAVQGQWCTSCRRT